MVDPNDRTGRVRRGAAADDPRKARNRQDSADTPALAKDPRHTVEAAQHVAAANDNADFAVHLLDVGPEEYGDAVLCQFGKTSVLIDGAHPGNYKDKGDDHPSIQRQIGDLLGQTRPPYKLSLLIVTHAHLDHIGCLPALVEQNLIAPDWALVCDENLGWGILPGDQRADALDRAPIAVRQLAAALREETRETSSRSELADFASDAATLEDRYIGMLKQLEDAGTRVVRFTGVDDVAEIEQQFAGIGLKILGPTAPALARCAEMNRGRSGRAADAATRLLGDSVDAADAFAVADAYHRIVSSAPDALDIADALGKDKGSINDESIVTRFRYQGVNLLFTGDMQLSQPEVSDAVVTQYITETLRQAIQQEAPYALVKLPHHGSYNGFDEAVWHAMGDPVVVGMCAGSGSKHHPNPQTLDFLNAHRRDVEWVRTDHNGRSTFTFAGAAPEISVTRGKLNDATPPGGDERVGAGGSLMPSISGVANPPGASLSAPAGATTSSSPVVRRSTQATGGERVEVTARIPHATTRVTITIDVQPDGGDSGSAGGQTRRTPGRGESGPFDTGGAPRTRRGSINLAGGRTLDPLLVLTNRAALARNIGAEETDAALDALTQGGHVVFDAMPTGPGAADAAAAESRRQLAQVKTVVGVLVLGGYDVVPGQRVDVLPARLRQRVTDSNDADDFIVWTDDPYGDVEGDALAELPVSRIPDGLSADLVHTALQANAPAQAEASRGMRNVMRPFAEPVFTQLPRANAMLVSRPVVYNRPWASTLEGENVYLMLHGSDRDASRFWGEDDGRLPVAMGVGNVPQRSGMVVFTGCCWGAMAVRTKAADVIPGAPVESWTVPTSIALTFLQRGARAFIGCTGSHYSPVRAPFRYFGGPMHDAFWKSFNSGRSPAAALLAAKVQYMRDIPHGQTDDVSQAIEFKILREYTCLGLGW